MIEGSLNSKLPTIWRVEKQMKTWESLFLPTRILWIGLGAVAQVNSKYLQQIIHWGFKRAIG